MTYTKRTWFLPTTIIMVIVLVGCAAALTHPVAAIRSEEAVRDTVTAFVASEKNVSHLESHESLVRAITKHYGPLVSTTLLEQWSATPGLAPGRRTVNASPDHIIVDTVAPQGAGYIMGGRVVITASEPEGGDTVGEIPVIIFLLKENGIWKVAAYQEQTTADAAALRI